MNQVIKITSNFILFVGISAISANVLAQNPVCAYCNIPLSAATKPSDHKPKCPYYIAPKSSSTSTPGSSASTSSNVAGQIIESVITDILVPINNKQQEAEEKAKQIEIEKIEREKAEKKRIQDEIDIEYQNKLMKSFKPLPGSKPVGIKSLPASTPKVARATPELSAGAAEALQEQKNFETDTSTWIGFQKQLFKDRLAYSNKWCNGLTRSLTSKVPPLPCKKFDELQPGDVLLIKPGAIDPSKGIVWADQLASGSSESSASHTVTFLKEVNGQKLFMDNQPLEGPTIISEKQFNERYGKRSMDVAQMTSCGVAQPLNNTEAENLFKAAVKMQSDNIKSGNTNYGIKGDNDIVCSEASWVLLKASGRKISGTDFGIKRTIGVNFSPADFYAQKQYFLVTPLIISK